MAKRKGGCLFILLILPIAFLFTLFAILFILGWVFYADYSEWQKSFENDILSTEYIIPSAEGSDDLLLEAEKKLDSFQKSDENVDFIEFTPEEIVLLVDSVVARDLNRYQIDRYYVDPGEGRWDIYMQLKQKNIVLPWLVIVVEKDNIESAEIFISSISVGDKDLEDVGFGFFVNEINDGYADALLTINENSLTKREWENISLTEEYVIIKGRVNHSE